jgi:kinesin family member 20
MVLGQCMEVMRSNQRKVAMSLAVNGRSDTRDVKHGLKVVPFRHSKLTEVLGEYFTGDGRVVSIFFFITSFVGYKGSILQVMIVNVNPYDTGYDENSHVMKFAALAKEVYTTPMAAPLYRAPSPTKLPIASIHHRGPLRDPEIIPLPYVKRRVTIELKSRAGKKESETCLEVTEEDEDVTMGEPEDGTEDASDGEGISPLVDALFTEIEELRAKVRCPRRTFFCG